LEEGDEKVLHNKKAHIGGVLALFFLALFLGGCGGTNRSGLQAGAEPGTCEAIGLGCTDGEASGPALVDSDGDGNPDDTPPEDGDNGGGPPTQPPVPEVPEDPPFVSENAPARGSRPGIEATGDVTVALDMTSADIEGAFNGGAEKEALPPHEAQFGRTSLLPDEDVEQRLENLGNLGIEERYYEAAENGLDYLYLGEGGATMTLDVVGVYEQRLEYARLGRWNFSRTDNPAMSEYFTFADNRVTLDSRSGPARTATYTVEGDVIAASSTKTHRFFPTGDFVVNFAVGDVNGTLAATLTTDAAAWNDPDAGPTDQEQFNFGDTRPDIGSADSAFRIIFDGFVGTLFRGQTGNFGPNANYDFGGSADDSLRGVQIEATGDFSAWNGISGKFFGNFYDDSEAPGSPAELAGWFSASDDGSDDLFIRGGFLGKQPERE
jgi:hypothetical protein